MDEFNNIIPNKIASSSKKDRFLTFARIIISLLLLFFIILKNYKNFSQIYSALTGITTIFIILAALTHLFMLYVESLRWDVLLKAQGAKINRGYLFTSMLIGFFYNNLLPSNIGGDFFRIYDMAKNKEVPMEKSASAVFIERFLGLITITIFFISTSFSIYRMLKSYMIVIAVFLGIAFVLFTMLSSPNIFKLDCIFNKFKKLKNTWGKIENFSNTVKSFKNKIPQLILALFLNIFAQMLFTVMFYFISISLGLGVSFSTYAFIVPVLFVIIGVPISVGGLGVRENAIIFMLNNVGVPNEKAVVFSIIVLFIHLFSAVAGGITYLFRNLFFRSKGLI